MSTATAVLNHEDYTFDEATHTYRLRQQVVPSVTQTLECCNFYESLGSVEPKVLERKRVIGEFVHKSTQLIEENRLDWTTVAPECSGYIDAYAAFLDDTGFKSRLVEHRKVATLAGMPCGMTIDREGLLVYRGILRPTVLDLKCTAQNEKYWGLQLAPYDMGLGRSPEGHKQRLRVAVQLKPDGKYKMFLYEDPADYSLFLGALSLTWWKINNLKKYRNGFHCDNGGGDEITF